MYQAIGLPESLHNETDVLPEQKQIMYLFGKTIIIIYENSFLPT